MVHACSCFVWLMAGKSLVLPLICLDDVDASLGTPWCPVRCTGYFDHVQRLLVHAVPARSRATPGGGSSSQHRNPPAAMARHHQRLQRAAVIDSTGAVHAGSRLGERTLVMGELPVGPPPRTLMVAWVTGLGAPEQPSWRRRPLRPPSHRFEHAVRKTPLIRLRPWSSPPMWSCRPLPPA